MLKWGMSAVGMFAGTIWVVSIVINEPLPAIASSRPGCTGRLLLVGRGDVDFGAQGIACFSGMLQRGEPSWNPVTILYYRAKFGTQAFDLGGYRVSRPVETDLWIEITQRDQAGRYLSTSCDYFQQGNVAYIKGVDGVQIRIMDFTPEELYEAIEAASRPTN
jgi:hypothetical protein